MHRGLEVRPSQDWKSGASTSSRVRVELLCVGTKGWRSTAAATSRRRVPPANVTLVAHLKSLFCSRGHSSYGGQGFVPAAALKLEPGEWVDGSSVRGWTLMHVCWTRQRFPKREAR